jgi:acetylglutamate kinase
MKDLKLIKVGGGVVEDESSLNQLLTDFAAIESAKILVHGGGRLASKIADQLGVENKLVDGRRITDADTLRIVTMVYGGLVNKNIVARLQAKGVNATGLTGADMNILLADKRPVKEIDYGYVGDIKAVNTNALQLLIDNGFTPVLSPLTHDGVGNMLNTNADTIAAEAAKALAKAYDVTLIYCFEKKGVLLDEHDDDSVIPVLTRQMYNEYKASGVISGGMLPKLTNAFTALTAGVKKVIITNAGNFAGGTVITG